MMQFYKNRDFGALISDTFSFFKIYGKNYFKNYFLINGLLVILFSAVIVLGYRELVMQLFAGNVNGESYYFEEYFQDNIGVLILFSLVVLVLALIIGIISFTFPIFYLKRIAKNPSHSISSDEILKDLKGNIKKIVILIPGLLFVVTPLFLFVYGISAALMIVIIGFFLLLITLPMSLNAVNFLLYDYFNTNRGFFGSLSFAIRAQFSYPSLRKGSPFWKYWATVIILMLMIYAFQFVITYIPMILLYGSSLATNYAESYDPYNNAGEFFGISFFIVYAISIIVSFVLNNFILVSAGLMYYDNRTDLHQQVDLLEIDSIGTNEA